MNENYLEKKKGNSMGIKRMISDPSIKGTNVNIDIFNTNSTKNYQSHSISLKELPEISIKPTRKQIRKHIAVLDEIGFSSLLESAPGNNSNNLKLLKKRFSIGISDFWSEKHKEKFLQAKGYSEAYKILKDDDVKSRIKYSKPTRNPNTQYTMNTETKGKSDRINHLSLDEKKSIFLSDLSESPRKKVSETPRTTRINISLIPVTVLVTECDNLAEQTKELKESTEKFHRNFSKQLELLQSPKKKKKRI